MISFEISGRSGRPSYRTPEEEIPVGEILVLVGFLFEEIRESAPRGEIIPLEAMDEQGQFPIGLIGAPEESPGFVIARKECSHG